MRQYNIIRFILPWADFTGIAMCVKTIYGFGYFDEWEERLKKQFPDGARMMCYTPNIENLFEIPQIKKYFIKHQYSDEDKYIIASILRFIDFFLILDDDYNQDTEDYDELLDKAVYPAYMYKELLQLWKYCEETEYKRRELLPLKISVKGGQSINLNNFDNYILRALRDFCKRHLNEHESYNDAMNQLSQICKGGRHNDDISADIIWGTYILLKGLNRDRNAKISLGICRFIYQYLQHAHIGIYDHIEKEEHVLKIIRSRIKDMIKTKKKGCEYTIPDRPKDFNPILQYADLYNDEI